LWLALAFAIYAKGVKMAVFEGPKVFPKVKNGQKKCPKTA
jgi:hypothetical protein